MKKLIFSLSVLALTTAAIAPAQADVRVGTLGCDVAPSVSYIIGSHKMINCVFYSANGSRERYVGSISRLGLDIGWTTGGKLGWWVYAPSRPGPGALAGGYGGVSAAATARAIREAGAHRVAFVPTDMDPSAQEDLACAGYIAALLDDPSADPQPYLQIAAASASATRITQSGKDGSPGADVTDVGMTLEVNRFDFAMRASDEGGLLVLRRADPAST